MPNTSTRDWRELCVAVTNEPDSRKLTSLVEELLEVLERGERNWNAAAPSVRIPTREQSPPETSDGQPFVISTFGSC